jgi:hypothetical protein
MKSEVIKEYYVRGINELGKTRGLEWKDHLLSEES